MHSFLPFLNLPALLPVFTAPPLSSAKMRNSLREKKLLPRISWALHLEILSAIVLATKLSGLTWQL